MEMRCEDAPTFRKWLTIVTLFVFCAGFQVLLFAASGAASSQPRIGSLEDWSPPSVRAIELGIGGPILIKAGDFNEDGKTDLIIAADRASRGHYQFRVFLLPGQGGGRFGKPLQVAQSPLMDEGRHARGIGLVRDLDSDGHLDLIIFFESINYTAPNPLTSIRNKLLILWGNGDGTFQDQWLDLPPIVIPMMQPASPIAVGDFDGDGWLDIAYPRFNPLSVVILYNKGNRALEEPKSVYFTKNGDPCMAVPFNLLAADLNRDGKGDIIVGGTCVFDKGEVKQKQYKRFIKVLLSEGKGSFQQSIVYISPVPDLDAIAPALWADDLNSDGDVDIAFIQPLHPWDWKEKNLSTQAVSYISMLSGNGDGSFNKPVNLGLCWASDGFLSVNGNTQAGMTFVLISTVRPFEGIRMEQGVPPNLGGGLSLPTPDGLFDALVTDIDNDGWAEIVAVAPVWGKATQGPATEYLKGMKIVILGRKK